MAVFLVICFGAASLAIGLAALVLWRDYRSLGHRLFGAGMLSLAIDAVLTGLSIKADSPEAVLLWQKIKLGVGGFIPALWLLFSLSFIHENHEYHLGQRKWLITSLIGIPFILGIILNDRLIREVGQINSLTWVLRFDWPGYLLQVFILVTIVLVLVSLERSFRASRGHVRWQIKFFILGLGSLFAIRLYTGSQELLFKSLDTGLQVVNGGALIVGGVLIARALNRLPLLSVSFYPSGTLLYGSLVALIIGVYFLLVGILAHLIKYFGGAQTFALQVFLVFLACVALAIFLLSDRLRHRIRYFISVHLKRPRYDYRKIWIEFSKKTSPITDVSELGMTVAKMVSEIMEVLSVTVWLLEESHGLLKPIGSTVFSEAGMGHRISAEAQHRIIEAMKGLEMPVDLDDEKIFWASELKKMMTPLPEARVRYCVSLTAGGKTLGFMTLGERVGYVSFSFEEFNLLKTIADQTAASLLNLKLSEDLRRARELEAFQSLSAFMIHDLKNLASSISLTAENLPHHFENPEYRKDALATLSQSVGKIRGMCNSLSLLSQKLELKPKPADLNEIIKTVLKEMTGSVKAEIIQELKPLPALFLDGEQMAKVIANLVINACEASPNGGRVHITTREEGRWAVVEVTDSGCGMSKEFIERSLFRPFKTTKRGGMGIGLFQSKMIVESHQGKIEVQSEEGKGSKFSIFLPVKEV